MVFDEESYQDQMYSDVPVEGVAAGTTFTLCGFRDAVFAEGLLVKGCVFERCVFVGCTFKNVRFENCAFNTCVFKTADFMGAAFKNCRLMGAELLGARCQPGRAQVRAPDADQGAPVRGVACALRVQGVRPHRVRPDSRYGARCGL